MKRYFLFALALSFCVVAENTHAQSAYRPQRLSRDETLSLVSNRTRISSAANLGSQITYTSADGRTYLWFPGNSVVLPGTWRIKATGGYVAILGRPEESYAICFTYGNNTVNAWTGARGEESCIGAEILRSRIFDAASGDVFRLSGGEAPPFVLPRGRFTIAQIKAAMNKQKHRR